MKTKALTRYALLVALAMVLSYLEAQLPPFFSLPGVKLGITNAVVLAALYLLGAKEALAVNLLRIFLVGLLFTNGVSLIYSLAGGLLSGGAMLLTKRLRGVSILTVSMVGGLAHNVGQLLAATLMLGTAAVAWYFVLLWFSGLAAGALVGLVTGEVCRRLKDIIKD